MLNEIGSVDKVPEYIKRVKAGEFRLMGFGHRVYKNYDPRARIIKQVADEVFEVTGKDPMLDIALELERIALEDEYFVKRKLYPNVDFYSGIIYQAMRFPLDMFPVLFAIPRTSGWLAQWVELLEDPDQKIARPRQIYLGTGRANTCQWNDADQRRVAPQWLNMSLSSFLIRIILLVLPGIASSSLYRHLRGQRTRKDWEDYLEILVFSFLCYTIYGLVVYAWSLLYPADDPLAAFELLLMKAFKSIGPLRAPSSGR